MPWTLPRLRASRRKHRQHARHAAAQAKASRRVALKQRAIVRKRTRQIAGLVHKPSAARARIVAQAEQAAANYRRNPGAYHYLAGGTSNTIYLEPSPRTYRSDCSQFAASVYKGAGLPSPAAPLGWEWASTSTIVQSPHARITTSPKAGDLGMYGARTGPLASRYTHHVEIKVDHGFIGHGSPPIDSLTPGLPDFYVTFDFLS